MNKGTLIGIAILFGIVALVAGLTAFRPVPASERVGDTFTVMQGPLTINITETGTIQPAEREIIINELEGKTTILKLIEEGTMVRKGDLLIELDTSSQRDALLDQEIRVQNTEAAFIGAREKLAVQKSLAMSNTSKAELDLEFANQDLEKYRKGEYPNELNKLKVKITMAEEELARAREKLDWSVKLHKEKYISKSELQADELAKNKAELNLQLARKELELLEDYTHKRKISELVSAQEQAVMALDRTRRKGRADVVQAEADLSAKKSEFKRQTAKLEKIREQIAKSKIYAPTEGQVLYSTSVRRSDRWDKRGPLREGRDVWENEKLIYLPTAKSMKVLFSIHEASLKKVKMDLPVRVTVEALPGQVYGGAVTLIAPLPNTDRAWLNPDLKVYPCEVLLAGQHPDLRAGMSCRVEIIVEEYTNAVYVPIQCVIRVKRETGVYVVEKEGLVFRPVVIGLDNGRMVHIVEGLRKGEEVSMTPSLSDSEAAQGDPLEKEEGEEEDEQEAEGKSAPEGVPGR